MKFHMKPMVPSANTSCSSTHFLIWDKKSETIIVILGLENVTTVAKLSVNLLNVFTKKEI